MRVNPDLEEMNGLDGTCGGQWLPFASHVKIVADLLAVPIVFAMSNTLPSTCELNVTALEDFKIPHATTKH